MKNKKVKEPETVCVILEKAQVHHLETIAFKMSVEEHRRVGLSELVRNAVGLVYPIEEKDK